MYKSLFLVLFLKILFSPVYGLTYYPCSQLPNKGKSIQIINFLEDHENKLELNSEGLESILLRPEVRDKELILLSIVGDFRKGKSFLLNLLLQYLETGGNGIDKNKVNLTHGFHWREKSTRDTKGILMWSEPFCVKNELGKELAILLMDTQGAFDNTQSVGDTATVFALAFLTSSIQLYNQKDIINEKDLQYLDVFTEYGSKIIKEGMSHKPFQKLLFLISDWQYPKEFEFGAEGGQKYLDKRILDIKVNQTEVKELRNRLESCFTNISCFLMPHPGKKVASGEFQPKDIDKDFLKMINELGKMLFKPDNSSVKKISGNTITGSRMVDYFKAYMDALKDHLELKPDSIKKSTDKANIVIALGDAKTYYTKEMSEKCSEKLLSVEPNELHQFYIKVHNQSINNFINQVKNLSSKDLGKKYLADLEKWIEEQFGHCNTQNQKKRIEELRNHLTKQLLNSNEDRRQLKSLLENVTKQLNNQQNKINEQQIITNYQLEIERLRNTSENIKKELNNQTIKIAIHEEIIKNYKEKIGTHENRITKNEIVITSYANKIKNTIPIGFIYVQLPSQSEPKTLWSTMGWKDVTSEYAGLFFRAEGGNSEVFGTYQSSNSPHLNTIYGSWGSDEPYGVVYSKEGSCTNLVFSGYRPKNGEAAKGDGWEYMKFCLSGGEVRPANKAMRIWKRIY